MLNNHNFDFIKINLVSPERIMSWSQRQLKNGNIIGEVTEIDTICDETLKPQVGGLFCERIFGPLISWTCNCKKNKIDVYNKFIACDNCGIEIAESRIRCYRMGYIKLHSSVTHIWYLQGIPRYICLLLKYKLSTIQAIVKCDTTITIFNKSNNYGFTQTGGIAIKYLLEYINLETELIRDRLALNLLEYPSKLYKIFKQTERMDKLACRIRVIENFISTNSKLSWMILDIIPVLPASLRPFLQLETGEFISSDLNELYTEVIRRNNRVKDFYNYCPSIDYNERSLLQEAVDNLIDNGKNVKLAQNIHDHPLKSLAHIIRGKYGRFRHNLLGKRVDYSARSVIIVEPLLKLNQCGLPDKIALILFEPFIINKLKEDYSNINIDMAKKLIQGGSKYIWGILQGILREHPVILNRAPTLHRVGIQAFEAILMTGCAIRLHPLVCSAFNADFDGDQMSVYIPLSSNAINEVKTRLLAYNNILSATSGDPGVLLTQDIILGCYYLTMTNLEKNLNTSNYFSSYNDILSAYLRNKISIHTPLWINIDEFKRVQNEYFDIQTTIFTNDHYVLTTVGRIFLNTMTLKTLHL